MSDKLTSLICPNCGATLHYDHATLTATFRRKDARTFVYVGAPVLHSNPSQKSPSDSIQCQHCKSNFAPATELQQLLPSATTVVIDTGGAAFIGGKVSSKGGDIIGGDKIVVTPLSVK